MSLRPRCTINGRFLAQRQTGVQRYAGEITRAIDSHLTADAELRRSMDWSICLPVDVETVPPYETLRIHRSGVGRGHVWEQTVLPVLAHGTLLNLANLGPLVLRRQIVCLHDANVFLEPTSYSPRFRRAYNVALPLLARRARAVTTVSHFSADMLARFDVTGSVRARVLPNGHEHALRWNPAVSRFAAPDALPRPFVFALGSRAPHKQIDLLVSLAPALDELGLDLVVSGGGASIFAAQTDVTAPNVRRVGFVTDDDLAALFARALCFAFPSRTEGFGLPLLEAMVHGAPILASRAASLPEVCDDAALYADPDDPSAWLAQITRLTQDDALRETLRARGRRRYPRYSWSDSAARYIDLVAEIERARLGGATGSALAGLAV